MRNPNKTAINEVFLQAEVFQGASYRGAGGYNANCPVFDGTLPPGACTMSVTTSANNGNGGSGTLVAGPAEWVLTLYEGFTTSVVRDQVRVRITLVGP